MFRTCITAQTVQTAVIIFNNWASQEISLYADGQTVEVEWIVGPIPINDNVGKEIIMRYDTDIQSQSKYYTDANGREVLERIRDYRPTWNYSVNEPVSGNYYPINSRIWIKDQNRQLTVLTGKNLLEISKYIVSSFIALQIVRKVVVVFKMVRLKSCYIDVFCMTINLVLVNL